MISKKEDYSEKQVLEEECSNNSNNETFEEVLARRLFIKGAAVSAGMIVINPTLLANDDHDHHHHHHKERRPRSLTFTPIQGQSVDTVTVPPGYTSQVVIRWGDPLFRNAPAFDPNNQTAEAQSRQFGYNCDFVGFFPL